MPELSSLIILVALWLLGALGAYLLGVSELAYICLLGAGVSIFARLFAEL